MNSKGDCVLLWALGSFHLSVPNWCSGMSLDCVNSCMNLNESLNLPKFSGSHAQTKRIWLDFSTKILCLYRQICNCAISILFILELGFLSDFNLSSAFQTPSPVPGCRAGRLKSGLSESSMWDRAANWAVRSRVLCERAKGEARTGFQGHEEEESNADLRSCWRLRKKRAWVALRKTERSQLESTFCFWKLHLLAH